MKKKTAITATFLGVSIFILPVLSSTASFAASPISPFTPSPRPQASPVPVQAAPNTSSKVVEAVKAVQASKTYNTLHQIQQDISNTGLAGAMAQAARFSIQYGKVALYLWVAQA